VKFCCILCNFYNIWGWNSTLLPFPNVLRIQKLLRDVARSNSLITDRGLIVSRNTRSSSSPLCRGEISTPSGLPRMRMALTAYFSGGKAATNQDRRKRDRYPVKKILRTPSKGRPAANLYTKPERLTVICSATWSWSEGANLYSGQLMALRRETKTYGTQ
jgi:hypothetical protein